ncbi:RadC family protein [Dethiobacter alkaliphilus]|uniref:RadC family protein n=1 Tax=Dethiobacter alkaliphilus TaxID=427926 RepID=UPI002227E5D1|nr:DNA repair protein RadC [Dethiobacter alkaliphilus]MCW3491354.1 DNA repair protein RadC [Dethiobacter alkaliphilus]
MTSRRLTIKDLPPSERPRERLLANGTPSLSDADLIAILIRSGTREETAVQLAERVLLNVGGLQELPRCGADDILSIKGLGPAKAVTILAAAELAKRLSSRLRHESVTVSSPGDAAGLVMEEMRHNLREHFRAIMLDTKNKVLGIEEISIGSLNTSLVHPREVFRPAIRKACASIILIHNHPSGDPTPSREDLDVTRRLREAGRLIGIEILDHIIIGDGKFISFREKGLLSTD